MSKGQSKTRILNAPQMTWCAQIEQSSLVCIFQQDQFLEREKKQNPLEQFPKIMKFHITKTRRSTPQKDLLKNHEYLECWLATLSEAATTSCLCCGTPAGVGPCLYARHMHHPNDTMLPMHLNACVIEELARTDTNKKGQPCLLDFEERSHPLIIEEYSSWRIILLWALLYYRVPHKSPSRTYLSF